MNYRHAYHAGNFADVLKHIVFILCIDYLQKKDGPICIVDAHGGTGFYDLHAEEAERTGEWRRGVGAFEALFGEANFTASVEPPLPDAVQIYADAVRGDFTRGHYPGSPLIAARRLRVQDRLIACELHEPAFLQLSSTIGGFPNTRALHMDAYQGVRAHVPPMERRGVVLIDPPYERRDEFDTLIRQMRAWKSRWATGVFLLWYPIKAALPVASLKQAAEELALPRTWAVELLLFPRDQPETLNGCGVIAFNVPYTVPERVEDALPYMKKALSLYSSSSEWLSASR